MANKIIVKNGEGVPPSGTLDTAELGFDKTNKKFYAGLEGTNILLGASEVEYLDGVTENIQKQMDNIDSELKKTIKISGEKQYIKGIDGNTPLGLNSSSSDSYLEFLGQDASLGRIGVNSSHQPVFYDTTNRVILHSNNYKQYVTLSNIGAQAKHKPQTGILTLSNWSSLSQTISVSGVTEDNTIIPAPAPDSYSAYIDAGVYCSSQSSGALTFKCFYTPEKNLNVNILILD